MVLHCFWLILIVGPRPNLDYLMIPYGFVMFSMLLVFFCLILIVEPRPVFGYLTITYGFVWFSLVFVRMFLVGFNRRPSPELVLSYDFLWFGMVPMVLLCFCLILIVGPRPIFRVIL